MKYLLGLLLLFSACQSTEPPVTENIVPTSVAQSVEMTQEARPEPTATTVPTVVPTVINTATPVPAATPLPTSSPTTPSKGLWQVEENVGLAFASQMLLEAYKVQGAATELPVLGILCSDDEPPLPYILWNNELESGKEYSVVGWTVDDNRLNEQSWSRSNLENFTHPENQNKTQFISEIMAGTNLTTGTWSGSGGGIVAVFDLTGIETAYEIIQTECE